MAEALARFAFECPRTWESLHPSAQGAERWCDRCETTVVPCATVDEARAQARRGRCVALPTVLTAPPSRRREVPILPSPAPRKTMITGMLSAGNEEGFPQVAWLVPLDGPFVGQTFRLGAVSQIGEGPPAEIVLPGAGLMTPHARFVASFAGYSVFNLSDAGTYLNGERIARAELVDNDVIRVGCVRLVFKTIN